MASHSCHPPGGKLRVIDPARAGTRALYPPCPDNQDKQQGAMRKTKGANRPSKSSTWGGHATRRGQPSCPSLHTIPLLSLENESLAHTRTPGKGNQLSGLQPWPCPPVITTVSFQAWRVSQAHYTPPPGQSGWRNLRGLPIKNNPFLGHFQCNSLFYSTSHTGIKEGLNIMPHTEKRDLWEPVSPSSLVFSQEGEGED
jgi:hypothetical protein